jgi:hypothetical protein
MTENRDSTSWMVGAEERQGLDGQVLALMSRSDEASLEEVDSPSAGRVDGEFKVMEGVVSRGTARVGDAGAPDLGDVAPPVDAERRQGRVGADEQFERCTRITGTDRGGRQIVN